MSTPQPIKTPVEPNENSTPEDKTEADKPKTSLHDRLKVVADPVESEVRKAHIEKDLEDIDIGQFLFQGYAEQSIPLALSVVFRTTTTRHTLWLERMMGEMVSNETVMYANHYGQILNLAAAIYSIGNGVDKRVLADLWSLEEESDYASFKERVAERVKILSRLPVHVTDDLTVNLQWFQRRVRLKLGSTGASDLGN